MKKILIPVIVTWIVLGFALSAHALLMNRGGGMIYSTALDITILQDANFAMTSGYDDDGYMTWTAANTWVQNLSYGGYDDWRLPTFDPDYNRNTAAVQSELAYIRYVELGPPYAVDQSGSSFDPAPFINLGVSGGEQLEPWYWSGTFDGLAPVLDPEAWRFDFW